MSVILDKEHGVNPGMVNCFFCNEPKSLVLYGKLTKEREQKMIAHGLKDVPDGKAPKNVVLDREPCDKCQDLMKQGVLLISVDDEKTTDRDNPYRTGGWCVLKDSAVRRLIETEELLNNVLKARIAFVPDAVWDDVGLPRGAVKDAQ